MLLPPPLLLLVLVRLLARGILQLPPMVVKTVKVVKRLALVAAPAPAPEQKLAFWPISLRTESLF
jgi:hypothetical protein